MSIFKKHPKPTEPELPAAKPFEKLVEEAENSGLLEEKAKAPAKKPCPCCGTIGDVGKACPVDGNMVA